MQIENWSIPIFIFAFISLFALRFFSKSGAIRLDRLCDWQRFDGGYERRRPRSRGSRDPSTAAILRVSRRKALIRRAPCACGRGFPAAVTSRTVCSAVDCVPFVVRKHVSGAVGICFPAEEWEFEAGASMSLLVLFSLRRNVHIFSFVKEKRVLFFAERIKLFFVAIFCYLCYYEQDHYQ